LYRSSPKYENLSLMAYIPYLVAAMITFDMGRQMGKGTRSNMILARMDCRSFEKEAWIIHPLLSATNSWGLLTISIQRCQEDIRRRTMSDAERWRFCMLKSRVFTSVLQNSSLSCSWFVSRLWTAMRQEYLEPEFKIGFQATTQPGYSSDDI